MKRTRVARPGGDFVANAPGTGRNVTQSMMSWAETSAREAPWADAARHRQFEEAASHPAGGGTAPRTPVVNADGLKFMQSTPDEIPAQARAGGVTAENVPASDAVPSATPAMPTLPAPVIIAPLFELSLSLDPVTCVLLGCRRIGAVDYVNSFVLHPFFPTKTRLQTQSLRPNTSNNRKFPVAGAR